MLYDLASKIDEGKLSLLDATAQVESARKKGQISKEEASRIAIELSDFTRAK